jgi:two-component system, OmpR family, sensor kinase
MSLRTRLIAGQIGLLALVCLIIVVVTEFALRPYLLDQLDSQLRDASKRASDFASGGPRGPQRGPPPNGTEPPNPLDAPGQAAGTINARVNSGRVINAGRLSSSGVSETIPLSQQTDLTSLTANGQPVTRTLGDLGDYRLIAVSGPRGDVIITGLPLSGVQSTQLNFGLILGGIALGGLLIAGVTGAVMIRRSLAPLHRVATTATRVTELPLDRGDVAITDRVPERDTDPRTEVGRVGLALNHMLTHVNNALAVRHISETRVRQFVADASHELRTPLTAVRGYAELVRRSGETVSPEVAHALHRVESEAARMTALVEDLLLLARLDSGRPLQFLPLDLSRLVVDVVSDARIAGPTHHWRLELPADPVTITGDDARLHQVLANLLSNANTHTPAGTTVSTSLSTVDGLAVLRVTDDGPGIAPELLPNIFERFARGDSSRSRTAGSTGLGLAIVAAVVQAHNGLIEVQSGSGETIFTVRLPLSTPRLPAPATQSE